VQGNISEEGMNRGKAHVTAASAVTPALLEMIQERPEKRCSAAIWLGLRDNQDEGGCRGERMMPLLFVVGKRSFSG
jgi:hypothetical protein